MLIIGCDFRTRYQQIAVANDERHRGDWSHSLVRAVALEGAGFDFLHRN
jgi:hypothetical protein